MTNSYIIINDNHENVLEIKAHCDNFRNLHFVASANNLEDGIDVILEMKPKIVFLEIEPYIAESKLSLSLISELHRYLKVVPKIIVTAKAENLAFQAIKYGVFDYLTYPFRVSDFRRTLFKLEKLFDDESATKLLTVEKAENISSEKENPLTLGIRSYGDYRFIDSTDVVYLQADNNSTDVYLKSGEKITAFKTLKHFEKILPQEFYRIHNSYILKEIIFQDNQSWKLKR